MTLEEIRNKIKTLEEELLDLKELEKETVEDAMKEKYEGKYVIKPSEKFAMHIITYSPNGGYAFGEGIQSCDDMIYFGRHTTALPNDCTFVDKAKFKEFIRNVIDKSYSFDNLPE